MIQGAAVQWSTFGEGEREVLTRPVALRFDRDERALLIANGVPVGARRATGCALLGAVLLLLAFVLTAIFRGS